MEGAPLCETGMALHWNWFAQENLPPGQRSMAPACKDGIS